MRSGEGLCAGCSTATGPIEETKRRKKKEMEADFETEIHNLRATSDNETSADTIIGGGTTANMKRKRENVERMEGSGVPESSAKTREPLVEFESMGNYKTKCFKLSVELEKKKVECTTLQGKLADETEHWRKMFSDLESRVLRMESSNSTMAECIDSRFSKLESLVLSIKNENSAVLGCVGSRISILESLVLRSGKEGSILRFVDSPDSVKRDSKARGLQNDCTQCGEKQRDDTSCEGKEYSHVYELKNKEKSLDMHENVEEGKGLGCSEERPSKHHLGMSKKPFMNLVSDNDSCESRGDWMDMLARNRNEDQVIKWKFEADMLCSFEEDPELCMKAICALHRHHIAEVEISTKGLFHYSDALRATTLANFLMDGACKGDLKKSVKELEKFDSKGVEDCKRLARSYSKQLFSIYENRKDPFFPSSYNCQTRRSKCCQVIDCCVSGFHSFD